MTVFIYVNTSKQVGDVDHLKVFANVDAAETWFEEKRSRGRRVRIRGSGVSRIWRRVIMFELLITALAIVWNVLGGR
jgi:hypothetical protein